MRFTYLRKYMRGFRWKCAVIFRNRAVRGVFNKISLFGKKLKQDIIFKKLTFIEFKWDRSMVFYGTALACIKWVC